MKKIIIAMFVLALGSVFAQETSVTIYNENLGVVKEVREIDIKEGITTARIGDVAEKIDPTSVKLNFDGNVLEQNYKYDLADIHKILNRYIDKNVNLIDEKGNLISGKLISVVGSSAVIESDDGTLVMLPKLEKYQIKVSELPEELITKPTLEYLIESEKSGKQNVNLSYQTSGISWHAEYVAVLSNDEKTLNLSSWVSIENNSGATYKDAKLKLVAGEINRASRNSRDIRGEEPVFFVASNGFEKKGFEDRSFFEFYIYELGRKSTISNNEIKQIAFIEANKVLVQKNYTYHSSLFSSQNEDDFQNFNVSLSFKNSQKNNLGKALPKGIVRIYKEDKNSLELVGEDNVKHTPKDEMIELNLGKSFDLVANEKLLNQTKISDKVTEVEKEITVKNHKNEEVVANVIQNIGNNTKVISNNMKFEKINLGEIKFVVPVNSNSEYKIIYKVRVTRG